MFTYHNEHKLFLYILVHILYVRVYILEVVLCPTYQLVVTQPALYNLPYYQLVGNSVWTLLSADDTDMFDTHNDLKALFNNENA